PLCPAAFPTCPRRTRRGTGASCRSREVPGRLPPSLQGGSRPCRTQDQPPGASAAPTSILLAPAARACARLGPQPRRSLEQRTGLALLATATRRTAHSAG